MFATHNLACCRPVNVPQPVGTTDPEVAVRLECVNQLTALLPSLHLYAGPKGSGTSHIGIQVQPNSSQAQSKGRQLALTEDWQLQGFLPLQQCQEKLVFDRQDEVQVSACQ